MFNSSDLGTQTALLELRNISVSGRPTIIWIGAGASNWAGFPRWSELAEDLHSKFLKFESKYDRQKGAQALKEHRFPLVFSLCKKVNQARYFQILFEALKARPIAPVYERFIKLLGDINPLRIITTNIDMSLEANLKGVPAFERSNIDFVKRALALNESFLLKLHGSSSEIENTIWTESDYAGLVDDSRFLDNLSQILGQASVLFVGYSLRDAYILELLERNNRNAQLLGDGPHFVVTSEMSPCQAPENVRVIQYLTSNFADHRGALAAIDLLRQGEVEPLSLRSNGHEKLVNAIYIPDYLSAGTWTTSQTMTFANEDGVDVGRAIVGSGFVQQEIPKIPSSALHDLVVGLMCFDRIYFPVFGIGRLVQDIGKDLFWRLVGNDVFRFVWKTSQLAILFDGVESISDGHLGSLTVQSASDPTAGRTLAEIITAQLPEECSSESGRDKVISVIDKVTVKFDGSVLDEHPALACGALLSPKLRLDIGLSDGILPTSIPEWVAFPVIRVATVVQDAEISRHLGALAAKMPFGSDALANATYGIAANKHSASDYVGYVVAGRFKAELGALVIRNPELLAKIVLFRETALGEEFRREVAELLESNSGAEFVAAVNGRLRDALSFDILERARDHFVDVRLADGRVSVLASSSAGADPFKLWRRRSGEILRAKCNALGTKPYDPCPCGSGDKLKFCCGFLLAA